MTNTKIKTKLAKDVIQEIKTIANIEARKNGFNAATKIIKGKDLNVVKATDSGYRKYTTGEYVSNAYRNNFGWKNTYYQRAECVISLPPVLWNKLKKWAAVLDKADIKWDGTYQKWIEI